LTVNRLHFKPFKMISHLCLLGLFVTVLLFAVPNAFAQTSIPEPVTGLKAVPVSVPPNTAQADQPSYRINPGDDLEIYVWGEERLQRVLRVLPDGTLAFPLAGQLKVQGLLPQQVEQLVSTRLSDQYRGEVPNVTVSVRNPAGLQFSVIGRVRSPGSFTFGRYANLLDALSMAGGPAEFASLDNVQVVRRQGEKITIIRARLSSLFRGNASPNDLDTNNIIQLLPGDVVIVP
jgi:polysaccharide biosynthesis/export protein